MERGRRLSVERPLTLRVPAVRAAAWEVQCWDRGCVDLESARLRRECMCEL